MKNTRSRSKKLLVLSLVLVVTLLSIGFTMSAFAEDNSDAVWTFNAESIKDPMYIQEHFLELPRAFEAEVKLPSGSLGSSSPIISNWTQSDTRDAFGFQLKDTGAPTIYYYQNAYDAANATNVTTKYMATFSYTVPRNEWVRLAVVNEIVDGNSVYKLYVNGSLQETVKATGAATFDAVYSQYCMRELSIGNDGKNYFKGEIRNVAVYETALTAEEAANSAKVNMQNGDKNLLAYYDATMAGNSAKFFKDQTGNGHDAASAFFERKEAVKDYAYSFAFIGDTQFLVEKDATDNTTIYASPIYDWIVANKTDKNIQRVFGLGDITDDNGKNYNEWEHAVALHEKLGAAGIPYSIIPGNHDDYKSHAQKYNNYFGKVSSFVDNIDEVYTEGRIENYYSKFEVGEHKYMVVALEYGAKDDVLVWANEAVAANPDRKVIVITHSLFDAAGEWAKRDTSAQTTTSAKDLNNGIDLWNEFISQHENIVMAVAGHISGDVIKRGQSVGVNGNVVNTFLINPQGFDKATGYDTGMVAMFYFSEDGSEVQVEYVSTTKTLRAQASNPDSDDILYHESNIFSFTVNQLDNTYISTDHGALPSEVMADNNFAVFSNGRFVSAHATWNAATQAVADIFEVNANKDVAILLLKDYTNTDDKVINLALYANGSLTIDLWKHTFTRDKDFLNLNSSSDLTNTAAANITVKNGTVRSKTGNALIANQITNKAYTAEKVWNITFDGVTLGYAEGATGTKAFIYQAWTNSATADDTQLGTKTNLVFNNCTFDLKTNVTQESIALFALKDDKSKDKIDVNVNINGGTVLADVDYLNNVTFYTLNEGSDSITFGAYNGSYTKLKTGSTAKDHAHYQGKLPAADGDRYFVEISDNGTESVYELRRIVSKNGGVDMTFDVSANAKYLSAVDYPFFVFDKDGNFDGAYETLYKTSNHTGAMNGAISILNGSSNTYNSETGKYSGVAYVVMRNDYTVLSTEKCADLAFVKGTVVVDLGGYSLIADSKTGSKNYVFDSYAQTKSAEESYPSYFVIKNGSLKTYNTPIVRFYALNKTSDVSSKLMSWTFEGVTFGLVSGSTYDRFFNISYSEDLNAENAPVDFIFNDCTMDLETVKPSGDFYVFRTNFAYKTNIKANVRINGGKILAKDLAKVYFDNFDTYYGSTLALGTGSDGEYIKVMIPSDKTFGFQIDSDTFGNITKKTDYGADVSFTYFGTEGTKSVYGIGVDSDYGAVPPEYADTDDYPFFVFDKDGNFYGAYGSLYGKTTAGADTHDAAMNAAIYGVLASKDTVYIVMRRDYTLTTSDTFSDLADANGKVIMDLGGFSLISGKDRTSSNYIFNSKVKGDASDAYPSYFVIKNGSIKTYASPVIRFSAYNDAKADANKLMSWTFEGVTFGLVSGSTYDRWFNISNAKSATSVAQVALNFNDCTFDLETVKPSGAFYVLRTNFANGTSVKADVRVNGGKILASDISKITLDNFDTHYGSTLKFGMGTDGEFLRVVLPNGASFSSFSDLTKVTANGTNVKFYLASTTGGKDTYTFGIETKYGTAPAKYEDTSAYPFFIFDSKGVFKSAVSEWALDNSASALSSSKNSGYKVLMRRDFTNSKSQYNNLSHTKDVTIDLGGFTLTNTGTTVFMAQKKPQDGKEQNSKITLINGTVIIGSRAFIKMDTSASTTSDTYGFDFTFEDLTIKMKDGASTNAFICQNEFVAGDPIQYCNFTFTNCVFDLSNATKEMTIFDVSDACCKVTAVLNGGKIITSSYGVVLWKNYASDPANVTANANSSLTFGKNESGNYTVLVVPVGATLPVTTVNGGALTFVKTADDGTNATYTLIAQSFGAFSPKTSVTLATELVYNVYVPVSTALKSFTVDDKTYADAPIVTLEDGKQYYHVAIALPSAEAARSIVLKATVTADENDYTGTWTMNVPKYAAKVIADGTDVEKALAKDLLAYVKAAYNYFADYNTAEEIARVNTLIDSILGDYKSAPTISGTVAKDNAGIVTDVTLNLDYKPTIRFYVTDTTVPFYLDGKKLNTVSGVDEKYGAYVELDVYAYALAETITFGDGGSYHISDFLTKSEGADYENLVACFVKYVESAAAYRNSVVKK